MTSPEQRRQLHDFIRESNRIEGITRRVLKAEVRAHEELLAVEEMTVADLEQFVAAVACARLRRDRGMNVRIANHRPIPGGEAVEAELENIVGRIKYSTPWDTHLEYERLHPFMDGNGRSGRALWAWDMLRLGRDPFALPFLHRWYYETLSVAQ